ncbi:MFS transporter [Candidatus Entotheonella palauensis]|uniref:MFS transporter n=1 Tax=Candidatus Entotheonella palauensis TaxID=93172 RepID=UPI0015C42923|nr:MFS transporter [Candidatus Entotheonella palauensis]
MPLLTLRERVSRWDGVKIFWWLCSSQSLSLIGSRLTVFSLGLLIYQETGSVTQYGLLTLFHVVPFILISPVAGVVVDRWRRRSVMLVSDTVAGISTFSLILLQGYGGLSLWHLYLMTAILSVISTFQQLAFSTSITLLISKSYLGRASGFVELTRAFAQYLPQYIAGLFLILIQFEGIVVVDGLTLAMALIILSLVRLPEPAQSQQTSPSSSWRQNMTYGWRYISERPSLLGLMLTLFVFNMSTSMLGTLFMPLLLLVTRPDQLAWILVCNAVGTIAGSLVMTRWGGPRQLVLGALGYAGLRALCMLGIGLQTQPYVLAVCAFGFMFGLSMGGSCTQALLLRKVPAAVQGRVFSIRYVITFSSIPLATGLSGPLADGFFEPAMATGGWLAGALGPWMGTGPGQGLGLMFCLAGLLTLGAMGAALRYRPIRDIDRTLPDAVD